MGLEWNCRKCTYWHKTHGTRCVMCNELRVSRQEMADFVMGKTVAAAKQRKVKLADDKLVGTRAATAKATVSNETTTDSEARPLKRPAAPSQPMMNAAAAVRNPYENIGSKTARATSGRSQGSSSVEQSTTAETTGPLHLQQQQPQPQTQTKYPDARGNKFNPYAKQLQIPQQPQKQQQLPKSVQTRNPPWDDSIRNAHEPQTTMPHENHPCSVPQGGTMSLSQNQKSTSQGGTVKQKQGQNRNSSKTKIAPKPAPAPKRKTPFQPLSPQPVLPYRTGPVPVCEATAREWIYPVNERYTVRDYQVAMSHSAVMHNTLVSLPTGLGKTLIAAVVMYNFHRWFPQGKVVFCAPTRPLVTQQISACYQIVGIPAAVTAEISGKLRAEGRKELWNKRRVFFCTPQTLQNDIEGRRCDAREIVCLVLDEAHKAKGDYAYTKLIKFIDEAGARFRVLGLSATPGTDIAAIQEVIKAFKISKIEARLDTDPSVKKYIHDRVMEIIKVKATSAVTVMERRFNDLIQPLLDQLRQAGGMNAIRGGNATITPYCLMRARDEYMKRTEKRDLDGLYFAVQPLVGMRSDLRVHGVGTVKSKMIRLVNDKKGGMLGRILKGEEFQALWQEVLKATTSTEHSQETPQERKENNPKLKKLDEILTEHFERARACGESSRAIVFSQWRDSVEEIVTVLGGSKPLLSATKFIGQGKGRGGKPEGGENGQSGFSGMNQREQQEVIKRFREGEFNIIVCTCIGEEGLDIGEVDLIVNFDCLRSPIRMIQRTGRTGRKRNGRVVCLVSEGQEEQRLISSNTATKTLGRALTNTSLFKLSTNPPMLPHPPILKKVALDIPEEYSMSQVGGHTRNSRARTSGNARQKGSDTLIDFEAWRLTADDEENRQQRFGNVRLEVNRVDEKLTSTGMVLFPQIIRRQCLKARLRLISQTNMDVRDNSRNLGISSTIANRIESKYIRRRVVARVPSSPSKKRGVWPHFRIERPKKSLLNVSEKKPTNERQAADVSVDVVMIDSTTNETAMKPASALATGSTPRDPTQTRQPEKVRTFAGPSVMNETNNTKKQVPEQTVAQNPYMVVLPSSSTLEVAAPTCSITETTGLVIEKEAPCAKDTKSCVRAVTAQPCQKKELSQQPSQSAIDATARPSSAATCPATGKAEHDDIVMIDSTSNGTTIKGSEAGSNLETCSTSRDLAQTRQIEKVRIEAGPSVMNETNNTKKQVPEHIVVQNPCMIVPCSSNMLEGAAPTCSITEATRLASEKGASSAKDSRSCVKAIIAQPCKKKELVQQQLQYVTDATARPSSASPSPAAGNAEHVIMPYANNNDSNSGSPVQQTSVSEVSMPHVNNTNANSAGPKQLSVFKANETCNSLVPQLARKEKTTLKPASSPTVKELHVSCALTAPHADSPRENETYLPQPDADCEEKETGKGLLLENEDEDGNSVGELVGDFRLPTPPDSSSSESEDSDMSDTESVDQNKVPLCIVLSPGQKALAGGDESLLTPPEVATLVVADHSEESKEACTRLIAEDAVEETELIRLELPTQEDSSDSDDESSTDSCETGVPCVVVESKQAPSVCDIAVSPARTKDGISASSGCDDGPVPGIQQQELPFAEAPSNGNSSPHTIKTPPQAQTAPSDCDVSMRPTHTKDGKSTRSGREGIHQIMQQQAQGSAEASSDVSSSLRTIKTPLQAQQDTDAVVFVKPRSRQPQMKRKDSFSSPESSQTLKPPSREIKQRDSPDSVILQDTQDSSPSGGVFFDGLQRTPESYLAPKESVNKVAMKPCSLAFREKEAYSTQRTNTNESTAPQSDENPVDEKQKRLRKGNQKKRCQNVSKEETGECSNTEDVVVRPRSLAHQKRINVFSSQESPHVVNSAQKRERPQDVSFDCVTLEDTQTPCKKQGAAIYDEPSSDCITLQDTQTPCDDKGLNILYDTPSRDDVLEASVVNPPLSLDVDVVCAICFSGHSPNGNPIILCEGPENDNSCSLAVHKSCYHVTRPLDDDWWCDPCDEKLRKRKGGKNRAVEKSITCAICQREEGALRKVTGGYNDIWFHPLCASWSFGMFEGGEEHHGNAFSTNPQAGLFKQFATILDEPCSICTAKGALGCSVAGCREYAHPHCSVSAKNPKLWSLVHVDGRCMKVSDAPARFTGREWLLYCPDHQSEPRELLQHNEIDLDKKARLPLCVDLTREGETAYVEYDRKQRVVYDTQPSKKASPPKRKRLQKKAIQPTKDTPEVLETSSGARRFKGDDTISSKDHSDLHVQKRKKLELRVEKRRRALKSCNFIDLQAAIGSDDDIDGDAGEEDEVRQIEQDEMSHDSFINDSSQLGYETEDVLDRCDREGTFQPMSFDETAAVHRMVDNEKERSGQFATPILNRRMKRKKDHDEWDTTQDSAPSSQKGLGNMNFIRSVIEHHRKGGEADEVESGYHDIVRQHEHDEANNSEISPSAPRGPIVMNYVETDSEHSTEEVPAAAARSATSTADMRHGHVTIKEPTPLMPQLTEAQKSMIEAKRQEALRKQKSKHAVINIV